MLSLFQRRSVRRHRRVVPKSSGKDMALAKSLHRLTDGEYLQMDRLAEFKSEFFDGEMFAMSGGTRWHSLIGANLAREFGNRLKGHRCIAYNSELRVKVEATGLYTYPDLSVVCGPPELLDNEMDTLLNPSLIAEVLSDSTEAYDRGKKFEHYRQIATLNEYLLVSQKEPRIEQFIRKPDGVWEFRTAAGLSARLELPSLSIAIDLAEVFANVEFSPAPIRATTPPRVS